MGFRMLAASDAYWRPSNQMGVLNTDLAKQLEAQTMGARLWRLEPGQASTRHRHRRTAELYVLLEGTGRLRVEDTVLTLDPLSAVVVDPETVRQAFNDTDGEQLWLVVGAPPESANTLEMTGEEIGWLYPDGPKAMPPWMRPSARPYSATFPSLARLFRSKGRPPCNRAPVCRERCA